MVVVMRISHGVRGDRHGSGPSIRRDDLGEMRSMGDGQIYTSKSAYYKSLKHQGLEIDDRPRVRESNHPEYDPKDLKGDIARAIANPDPRPDINSEEPL